MNDIREELKNQSLFNSLTDSDIEKFIPLVSVIKNPKDVYVFKEGDECKGIYMIKKGRVEITKKTPDGWYQPLAILEKNNFMGEIALLENTTHTSNARTLEQTELFLIPKEHFQNMEKKDPFIILKIIKNIAIITGLNLRRMNEKFIRVLVNY